jgi:ribosome modulation factor
MSAVKVPVKHRDYPKAYRRGYSRGVARRRGHERSAFGSEAMYTAYCAGWVNGRNNRLKQEIAAEEAGQ